MPLPRPDRAFSVIAPAQMPAGECYYIHGSEDDDAARQVRALLEFAAPDAVCCGISESSFADAAIVFFDSQAVSLGEAWARGVAAVTAPRCYVLPLPYGYPWAFWDVWRWYDEHPELRSSLSTVEAYRQGFRASPYLGGAKTAARITDFSSLGDSSLYWREAAALQAQHRHEIDEVRAGLADPASRSLYDLTLDSDPRALWQHFVDHVFSTVDYLDHDQPRRGEDVLNLGVFTGHEIPYLLAYAGPRGVIHCVDPVGLDLVSTYAAGAIASCASRVREGRFAAGAGDGQGSFLHYPDGQACLDPGPQASSVFAIRSLDDYATSLRLENIGMIKIDIEGMEAAALDGMTGLLARTRPTVSLAIYHSAAEMWTLPLRLMQELRDYRFHISHCSPVRWETVLTAVPRERERGLNAVRSAA